MGWPFACVIMTAIFCLTIGIIAYLEMRGNKR